MVILRPNRVLSLPFGGLVALVVAIMIAASMVRDAGGPSLRVLISPGVLIVLIAGYLLSAFSSLRRRGDRLHWRTGFSAGDARIDALQVRRQVEQYGRSTVVVLDARRADEPAPFMLLTLTYSEKNMRRIDDVVRHLALPAEPWRGLP